MKTVALHTLGCKLNFAETASIGRQFHERGYRLVDSSERSDVFVLNTCSVTERADRECRQLIRRVRRRSPNAYVIVTGCYAQLRAEDVAAIEGVDLVLGSKEKFNLFDFTEADRKEQGARIYVSPIGEVDTFGKASSSESSDRTRAFLKIQDGCDYTCSFCTIPLARGVSRSLSVDEVSRQAEEIVEQGYKEIVLTGVNVGDYGRKIDSDLLALLQRLVSIGDLERIRISSVEPNLLNDTLIDFWLSEPKLCNHFHIPLQSGSDTILGLMRRRYQTALYRDKIERIKSQCPDAGIGADVLVGFPGESDAIFDETYGFLRESPLSYFHIFTYSERPNTPASQYPDVVEPRVRTERSERLRMLGIRKRRLFYESHVGKELNVLFECEQKQKSWSGLTENYIRVVVESERPLANQVLSVQIMEAANEHCIGRVSLPNDKKRPLNRDTTLMGAATI